MIVGICGEAGSGKDTVASFLREDHGYASIAFADPIKRHVMEIFGFSPEKLWGPSERRARGDGRYPLTEEARDFVDRWTRTMHAAASLDEAEIVRGFEHSTGLDANEHFLSARKPCQLLGTEFGRACWPSIWIEVGIREARRLDGSVVLSYDPALGPRPGPRHEPWAGVTIADVRFRNEVDAVNAEGGRVLRVRRPGAGLSGAAAAHLSELEMRRIPDEAFFVTIENEGGLDDLRRKVAEVVRSFEP